MSIKLINIICIYCYVFLNDESLFTWLLCDVFVDIYRPVYRGGSRGFVWTPFYCELSTCFHKDLIFAFLWVLASLWELLFVCLRVQTTLAKHCFYFRGTQIWNSLNPILYTTRKREQLKSVYQSLCWPFVYVCMLYNKLIIVFCIYVLGHCRKAVFLYWCSLP